MRAYIVTQAMISVIKSLDIEKENNWLKWFEQLNLSFYYVYKTVESNFNEFPDLLLKSVESGVKSIISIRNLENFYVLEKEDKQENTKNLITGVITLGKSILWDIHNKRQEVKNNEEFVDILSEMEEFPEKEYSQKDIKEYEEMLNRLNNQQRCLG